jgi:hypothetical protein
MIVDLAMLNGTTLLIAQALSNHSPKDGILGAEQPLSTARWVATSPS